MALDLLKRSENGAPLSATEHDANLTAIETEVNARLKSGIAAVSAFGTVIGDGVTAENALITAAEASSYGAINLEGETIYTTLTASTLTKKYFNGKLYANNSDGHSSIVRNRAPVSDYEIETAQSKSPITDWAGQDVLWLGTSIPHFGAGTDSYPDLIAAALGCTVNNMAWSGSTARYDAAADAFAIATVKCLSMTEDERAAGEALYGPTSAYHDGFDTITAASQMTCDYRIKTPFQSTPFNVVVLDHNHNDRRCTPGTLTPTALPISGITKGATTTITLASSGLVSVGQSIVARVTGIADLDYVAARVQSVAGADFTINIDSSGFSGSFSSGTAYVVDKTTLYGAFQFLLFFIKNCSLRYGDGAVKVILNSAPSEFTNSTYDRDIVSNARYLKAFADYWNLPFFDVRLAYGVNSETDHDIWFPDGVHPSTTATRQALANVWIDWLSGGAAQPFNRGDFLAASDGTFTVNHEALLNPYSETWGTPAYVRGAYTAALTEDWVSFAEWTVGGVSPSVGAAPWGSGNALLCTTTLANPLSYLYQAASLSDCSKVEFDVYLPVVSGLTSGTTKTVSFMTVTNSLGQAYFSLQFLISPTAVSIRPLYFETPNVNIHYLTPTYPSVPAAQKITVTMEAMKSPGGGMALRVNGTLVCFVTDQNDSGQPNPGRVYIGFTFSNLGSSFDAYFGPLTVSTATKQDYSSRRTGSFTSLDGKTITVVNGIETAEATAFTPAANKVPYFTGPTSFGALTFDELRNAMAVDVSDMPNGIFNGNFEKGDTGFTKLGTGTASIVNEPANAFAGNWVAKFTGSGAPRIESGFVYVEPGDTVYYAARLKTSAGCTGLSFFAQLLWYDKDGAFLSGSTGTVYTSDQLTYVVSGNTGTAPANTAQCKLRIQFTNTAGTGYCDSAIIFRKRDAAQLLKANSVTLAEMATMATASFLGRNTAGTGNVEVLSKATAKTLLDLSGTNTGDETASGILAKLITVDGSGSGLDADTLDGTSPTAFGLSLIDDANASAARTTLGLGSGALVNITVSSSAPGSPAVNDLWVDTT